LSVIAKCRSSLCFLLVLLLKILQTLTEESNPSANLVVAVKHLYETKLKVCLPSVFILYRSKNCRMCPFSRLLLSAFAESCNFLLQDASILIPLLSSFPKEEVLVSFYICIIWLSRFLLAPQQKCCHCHADVCKSMYAHNLDRRLAKKCIPIPL
jgi:hypothetical protein